jgi:hypothetical protein
MLKNYWPIWRRLLFAQTVFYGLPFGLLFYRYQGKSGIVRRLCIDVPLVVKGNGGIIKNCVMHGPKTTFRLHHPEEWTQATVTSGVIWPKKPKPGLYIKG